MKHTQRSDRGEPGIGSLDFIADLRKIVGRRHVLTRPASTYRYRRGYRFGAGAVQAVVRPGSLVELWRVAQACTRAGKIVIMQAANTGLTGGSTPDGNDYDRDIVLIGTLRLSGIHLIDQGRQVVCLPGATLNVLETLLSRIGREPHSVIGSSCIGASVLGGISNNSGGALIQRGPAFTEMALFGRIGIDGRLQLVNHLGIELGEEPELVLSRVEKGEFTAQDVRAAGKGHDADYARRIRDVDADTPARFNADAARWFEAAGCAGKLIVFAVRLDTFEKQKDPAVFYIGTNETDELERIRRDILTTFGELPIAGEYIHREAFDIAETYGKDTFAMIRYFGTRRLPLFFALKARFDIIAQRVPFLPTHLSDRLLQAASRLLPQQVAPRVREYRDRFEHHLMLKVSSNMRSSAEQYLKEFFTHNSGDFFQCSNDEGARAFLHRFAAAGAAVRYRAVHSDTVEDIVALDIALRRNDRAWFEKLPAEIENKITLKLYYGHFFCHVMHQDYAVRKGYDAMAVEHEMLPLLDQRGARYPAEHNVGHLYEAPSAMLAHYRELDPCNCFNPGIGKATKKRNWVAESVEGCDASR